MQRAICFFGGKGTGKDSALAAVQRCHPVITMAFADALKEMALTLDYPKEVLWGPTEARNWVHPVLKLSARKFLQTIGEAIRKENAQAWIDLLLARVHELNDIKQPYGCWLVITDARHRNEVEAIKAAGIPVYQIRRPDADATDMHESEVFARSDEGAEVATGIIVNDGTLEDFERKVLDCLDLPERAVRDRQEFLQALTPREPGALCGCTSRSMRSRTRARYSADAGRPSQAVSSRATSPGVIACCKP